MRNGGNVQEEIKQVSYEEARKFIKSEKNLILKREYKYFALFYNNEIVSLLGLKEQGNVKVHCNYTPIEKRGNGYFTRLLLVVMDLYKDNEIVADCLQASKNIYLRNGFDLVCEKKYKSFTIYKVKKTRDK